MKPVRKVTVLIVEIAIPIQHYLVLHISKRAPAFACHPASFPCSNHYTTFARYSLTIALVALLNAKSRAIVVTISSKSEVSHKSNSLLTRVSKDSVSSYIFLVATLSLAETSFKSASSSISSVWRVTSMLRKAVIEWFQHLCPLSRPITARISP